MKVSLRRRDRVESILSAAVSRSVGVRGPVNMGSPAEFGNEISVAIDASTRHNNVSGPGFESQREHPAMRVVQS